MADFPSVVKELDIKPASTTPVTQSDQSGNIAKYGTLKKARTIGKLTKQLTIVDVLISGALFKQGALLAQFNFQADKPFIILDKSSFIRYLYVAPGFHYYYAIKWVESDGTIKRYILKGIYPLTLPESIYAGRFPLYQHQTIQPNFTIEFWSIDAVNGANNLFFNTGTSFNISLLTNPISPDDVTHVPIVQLLSLTRTRLGVAMPEQLPTQYNDGCNWGTNP